MKDDLAGYRFETVQRNCAIVRSSKNCSQHVVDEFENAARDGKFDVKAIPKPEAAPRRIKVLIAEETSPDGEFDVKAIPKMAPTFEWFQDETSLIAPTEKFLKLFL